MTDSTLVGICPDFPCALPAKPSTRQTTTWSVLVVLGEFDLMSEGDRIGAVISGHQDSLAPLELLIRHRRKVGYEYELAAVHVGGMATGLPDARFSLEPWFRRFGVEYLIVPHWSCLRKKRFPLTATGAHRIGARHCSQ
ncbi:MAG: hypothetical protein MUQ10_07080 [Anaerolineae bacterium]|nr:hypothetical protein [Anaerolineae bacterium]